MHIHCSSRRRRCSGNSDLTETPTNYIFEIEADLVLLTAFSAANHPLVTKRPLSCAKAL